MCCTCKALGFPLLSIATACLQESGGHVSHVTRKLANMKSKHCDRDFFRFVRLPIAAWLPFAGMTGLQAFWSQHDLAASRPAAAFPGGSFATEEFAWVDVMLKDLEDPTQKVPGRLPFIDPHEYMEYLWRNERVDVTPNDITRYWSHLRSWKVEWAMRHPAASDAMPVAVILPAFNLKHIASSPLQDMYLGPLDTAIYIYKWPWGANNYNDIVHILIYIYIAETFESLGIWR